MSNRRSVLSMLAGAGVLATFGESTAQAKSDLQQLKESKVIRVGAAAAFPFYERAVDGKWQGLVPEMMQLIAPALGVSVEYVDTTWGTAAAGLQSNRFDLMGAFNRTPERATAVDFIPYRAKKSVPILSFPKAMDSESLAQSSHGWSVWQRCDKKHFWGRHIGRSKHWHAIKLMYSGQLGEPECQILSPMSTRVFVVVTLGKRVRLGRVDGFPQSLAGRAVVLEVAARVFNSV